MRVSIVVKYDSPNRRVSLLLAVFTNENLFIIDDLPICEGDIPKCSGAVVENSSTVHPPSFGSLASGTARVSHGHDLLHPSFQTPFLNFANQICGTFERKDWKVVPFMPQHRCEQK